jgi:hypothetical protein
MNVRHAALPKSLHKCMCNFIVLIWDVTIKMSSFGVIIIIKASFTTDTQIHTHMHTCIPRKEDYKPKNKHVITHLRCRSDSICAINRARWSNHTLSIYNTGLPSRVQSSSFETCLNVVMMFAVNCLSVAAAFASACQHADSILSNVSRSRSRGIYVQYTLVVREDGNSIYTCVCVCICIHNSYSQYVCIIHT